MGEMTDTPLGFQTPVGTHPSIQMTSSMCKKKGRHLFVAHETNLFNAVILSFKLCTSLTVFGGASSIMARTFSGLTSILL